jgi:hypothetical protein
VGRFILDDLNLLYMFFTFMSGSYLCLSIMQCRRVVRPWLGLKMLDLNPMIISQLKEKSSTFPDVRKGVLVPMVSLIK